MAHVIALSVIGYCNKRHGNAIKFMRCMGMFRTSFSMRSRTLKDGICLVRHGKIVRLVQVAYTIAGDKTRKRETESLLAGARRTGCRDLLLITDHERDTISDGGYSINVIAAREWLVSH